MSLVSICSVVVFLSLGFVYGLWHSGWIVFFAAPVTAAILKVVRTPPGGVGERVLYRVNACSLSISPSS